MHCDERTERDLEVHNDGTARGFLELEPPRGAAKPDKCSSTNCQAEPPFARRRLGIEYDGAACGLPGNGKDDELDEQTRGVIRKEWTQAVTISTCSQ